MYTYVHIYKKGKTLSHSGIVAFRHYACHFNADDRNV